MVADHVLMEGKRALWVDAGREARTRRLADVAPSPRILERIDVVAGFTCVDDLSNRTDQRVEQNWVRGKAFDNAAPLGPVVASPEDVPDDASVELRVNGEVRQQSSREQFIFSVPELLAEITSYLTLEPGDVISTGTPAGVGPLADGDTVEVAVEGVGTLEHDVRID